MKSEAEILWNRIIEKNSKLEMNGREALNLQPGATAEEFQLIETTLGITLTEEMKSFYSIFNGQDWSQGVLPFARNLTLSPISEIIDNWEFLQEEIDPDDLFPDIEYGVEVKPTLWNKKWIPIAENGGGDYLCLDTDPTKEGVVGQVLYFWHDWGNRTIEAKGLFEFIEICLNEKNDSDI
ncbi:SMI1/KNR4 family protein [Lysinibacillus sp. KCTC 33748]|uniref:SMI1/KNR4 family protein n=2 Tax=Lysinibacillus TaxID=400634 RepID=UPI0009A5ADEA|nr:MULTISPECIES: SMI1/KNR4 family protein [unclassified Lysinibacillus]OXS70198.1 SMI1/KNR4 family protein [Lysinibacillus sp. KCTC 33748]SKC04470.1 Cell wall assembly regulator SMI1 [Lysinibacillus sp. AC-3]